MLLLSKLTIKHLASLRAGLLQDELEILMNNTAGWKMECTRSRPTAATAAVEFDIRTLIIELCQTAGGSG
ncbi:hypothetical protein T10_4925 [Trichinella papuae]|uniref:Uncharacterized protein n=1 Tax=Trichinella papuae TaxID=268474 RepID=A0A0V1M4X5_9BILA|nr:hypothetical protein T10_4925 [Trichinella papuae]